MIMGLLRRKSAPRQRYVVIVKTGEHEATCYGPYASFKKAEGDAQAWDGYVLPLDNPKKGVKR